jgi:hypothetical protein
VKVWSCEGNNEMETGVSTTVTGALTDKLNCLEFEPAAFVAVTVGVNTPVAVGIPLMIPVDEASDNPAGKAPPVTLQVIGAVPVATIVCV